MNKIIKVSPEDNAAVALVNLIKGETVELECEKIKVVVDVKAKHKIALRNFEIGSEIIMYGVIVGKAHLPIEIGELLTTENLKHHSAEVGVINSIEFFPMLLITVF